MIRVGFRNRLTAITTRHHVIKRATDFKANGLGHATCDGARSGKCYDARPDPLVSFLEFSGGKGVDVDSHGDPWLDDRCRWDMYGAGSMYNKKLLRCSRRTGSDSMGEHRLTLLWCCACN